MPRITYIAHDGTEHTVEAAVGTTVMNAAIDNGVPGIDADCGGRSACGTCHVFVRDEWLVRLRKPRELEKTMLQLKPERQDNSRLACQIPVTQELDGLVVKMPEFQF